MQSPRRRLMGAVLALVLSIASTGMSQDASSNSDREKALDAIKRRLGPKGNELRKESMWYVVLLRERTPGKISVTYIKVQGQEATAEAICDFLRRSSPAYRDFGGLFFPDTAKGRKNATAFHESEILAGLRSVLMLAMLH